MSESINIDKIARDRINRDNRVDQDLLKLKSLINKINDNSSNLIVTGSSTGSEVPSSYDNRDTTAIHVNAALEINGVTEKTALVDADEIILEDTEDFNNKKKATVLNVLSSDHDYVQFDIVVTPTPAEGMLFWNSIDKTANIKTDTETIIQVGQEVVVRIINKTGGELSNGEVVYINGADVTADRPTAIEADASTWEDSQMTLGVMTSTVANNGEGFVTVVGLVRDVDTSGMSAGDRIYLSETTGVFTVTRPISPAYIIEIGVVVKVDASEGIIFVHPQNNDDYGFWNKSFIEAFDLTVAEDTGSVIASLQRSGGGNLTMRFSTGPFTTLVTPPMTKTLDPGTAILPKINYLYILESDQTQITLSTSSYPDEAVEHIKIAKVILLTAAITALDDPLSNQNSNDHALEHQNHVNEWIRAQRATYESPGIAGNSSTGDDYFEIETVPDKVYFRSTAGTIRQMHVQDYPVKDTGSIDGGGSDVMYVVNDPDAAYTRITDLIAGITKISDGTVWGNNKHIGLVFFGVISKTGEGQQLMCLLPSGQYNNQLGAENDINGYTNVSIPDIFRGTGFLICKIVAKKVGSTIEYESTLDLRGFIPGILTGAGGGAAIVSFPDNTFEIFDEADPTKLIEFQVSGVAAGNKRIITMPDKDLTLIDQADAIAAVEGEATLDLGGDLRLTDVTKHIALGTTINSLYAINAVTEVSGSGDLRALHWKPRYQTTNGFGMGIYIEENIGAGVTLTNRSGVHIKNPGGAGAVTNNFGLRIDEQIAGATSDFDILLLGDKAEKKTTTAWTATSDKRIKTVLRDYTDGLAKIMGIEPRVFRHNDMYGFKNTGEEHIGIVADEIELILPSTVKTSPHLYKMGERTIITEVLNKEGKKIGEEEEQQDVYEEIQLKKFNPHEMFFTMINAIKELKQENDEMRARLNILEGVK